MADAAQPPWWRRIVRAIERMLAVVGLIVILYALTLDLSEVVSSSMAPTLCGDNGHGDWVLTEKVSYWFRSPRRWEVVTFRTADGVQVMKRVVGLPGEAVSLQSGQVAIAGQPATCPSRVFDRRYLPYGNLRQGQTAQCGTGYYVLGDDSRDSDDSRYNDPVERARIRGRAWLIVWPPNRWGAVGP